MMMESKIRQTVVHIGPYTADNFVNVFGDYVKLVRVRERVITLPNPEPSEPPAKWYLVKRDGKFSRVPDDMLVEVLMNFFIHNSTREELEVPIDEVP